ncbi:MAG: dihydroorotase [Clostridiales bacterium]|nr:dihydroorotase [Clostridiales bacterium]
MDILIKNGLLIDPLNKICEPMDVLINKGKIYEVGRNIETKADKIINAENMWVTPGLIDLHTHAREPGFEYKETIETASESAMHGGFTTICVMPNTNPVTDNPDVVRAIYEKAQKSSKINVLVIGSITKGQAGEELADFKGMKSAGIIALSEDGKSVMSPKLMKEALILAKQNNLSILSHCEDLSLKAGGVMNLGEYSKKLGLKGIPKDCEETIIARDLILAGSTGSRVHICHISTKDSVLMVRAAKQLGIQATAEACPHHFVLSDDMITTNDGNFKMSPPIRSKEDVNQILEGLRGGAVDVIATDHAPHSGEEKQGGFENSLNGIVGLETALPLSITYLVNKNILTPIKLIEKLTINPARVIGLDRGALTVGAVADITIIDPNIKYKINTSGFKSKSKNSPFNNFEVSGKAVMTVVNGKIVMDRGQSL